MLDRASVIHSDPEILAGTPVFRGTHVPVRNLLDSLSGGEPLAEFLEAFPGVSREQAEAALKLAEQLLVAHVTAIEPRDEGGRQAAFDRFRRHFGEFNLGHPTGADNDSIDADLAREYADNHEDS